MELSSPHVVPAVVLAVSGFVVVWAARATAPGRLGRNGIAGIRTKTTMASDEAWLVAHRAGRWMTELGGWVLVVAALGSLIVPEDSEMPVAPPVVGAVTSLVFVLIGGRQGVRAAKTLLAEDYDATG